jgi:hypothetical protein
MARSVFGDCRLNVDGMTFWNQAVSPGGHLALVERASERLRCCMGVYTGYDSQLLKNELSSNDY